MDGRKYIHKSLSASTPFLGSLRTDFEYRIYILRLLLQIKTWVFQKTLEKYLMPLSGLVLLIWFVYIEFLKIQYFKWNIWYISTNVQVCVFRLYSCKVWLYRDSGNCSPEIETVTLLVVSDSHKNLGHLGWNPPCPDWLTVWLSASHCHFSQGTLARLHSCLSNLERTARLQEVTQRGPGQCSQRDSQRCREKWRRNEMKCCPAG